MSEELTLSEELRRAREAREETLEEVHQRTGIALTILRELESGDYNVVEPVYARLAIHHYASHLGLDGAAFEARLRSEVAATRPPLVEVRTPTISSSQSVPSPSPLAELIRSQPSSRLATIGVILVVGLAIVLYLLGSETPDPRATSVRSLPAPMPVVAIPPVPEQEPSVPLAGIKRQSSPATSSLAVVARQTLDTPAGPGTKAQAVTTTQTVSPTVPPPVSQVVETAGEPDAGVTQDAPETPAPRPDATLVATPDPAPDPAPDPTNSDRIETPLVSVAEVASDDTLTADTLTADTLTADTLAASTAVIDTAAGDTATIVLTPLVLQVDAVDSTWIQVQWDDSDGVVEIVPRGEQRTWGAERFFMVRAGRAHGVRFHFQGQLLGDGRLGDSTKVLRFLASAGGVQLLGPDLEPIAPIALAPLDTTEVPVRDRP